MLTTDDIFIATSRLRQDPVLTQCVRYSLAALSGDADYRDWVTGTRQRQPFEVRDGDLLQPLKRAGLVRRGRLQVRINAHGHRIFVTDGVWIPASIRAFPFEDESAVLLDRATQSGMLDPQTTVIDLACGCGHTALSLDQPKQILLDINPRAIAYVELNKMLNGLPGSRYASAVNDLNEGIPALIGQQARGSILVVGNVPFAPAPSRNALPLTSNGGADGLDLQLAAFKALTALHERVGPQVAVRALFLGLTVGSLDEDRWEIAQRAERYFAQHDAKWEVLRDERLLRINAVRVLDNPTPAREALPLIAECDLYSADVAKRPGQRAAFLELAARHEREGNPDLAYGLITVELA